MQQDIECLRHLARRYAEAAAHPRNRENEQLYRAVNGLRMIRPVVLIDEQPWSELNVDGALGLQCQDPFYRGYELYLRKKLFQWSHHPADMILLAPGSQPDFRKLNSLKPLALTLHSVEDALAGQLGSE